MTESTIYIILMFLVVMTSSIVLLLTIKQYRFQKKQLRKLRLDSDQKYFELADLLPQIVFESDVDGKIRFLNSNGLETFGLSRPALSRGVSIKELVINEEQEHFWQDYLYILEGGLNKGQQYLVRSAKNQLIPMMFYMSQIQEQEKRTGVRGIIIDITQQKVLEQKILSAVIDTEDRERKRFSEDLHDGLGPLLSTIRLYVNQIQHHSLEDTERESLLKSTTDLLDEAISSTKAIANNILPGTIADNGLVAALNSFCNRIESTGSIHVSLKTNIEKRLTLQYENTIYRIVIELINNTIKHAKATQISISLLTDTNGFELKYSDNGVGFDVDKSYPGLGLDNIRNRCKSIGGHLKMASISNKGFELVLNINKI